MIGSPIAYAFLPESQTFDAKWKTRKSDPWCTENIAQ